MIGLIAGVLPRTLLVVLPLLVACGPTNAQRSSSGQTGGSDAVGGSSSCGAASGAGSGGRSSSMTAPTIDDTTPTGPYRYRSVPILGGGFVTGVVFSPAARDVFFARTDIGGAYRWNGDHWMPLTDWVDRNNINLMGIESIACDPTDSAVVYLAAGTYLTSGDGAILRSSDGGVSWSRYAIGVPMGGNMDGRSMGERLAVDPNHPGTLYFGTRTLGLWRTRDASQSWSRVTSFPATGGPNIGLSFVSFDPSSGGSGQPSKTIYVGVADTQSASLYRSTDAGDTWHVVPGAPAGRVPHHGLLDQNGVLYLAYNDAPGPSNVNGGGVFRFDTKTSVWRDISPPVSGGIGGLSLDASRSGTLLATTIDVWPGNIYRTTDDGKTWREVSGPSRRDAMGAEYLYFGGNTLSTGGWMGDAEIDPFNPDRALYITGQGVWWTDDLTAADCGQPTHWAFVNQGLEETVALDLAAPPSGPRLLSAVGDIGGFRHDDLDNLPAAGMYENPVFGNTVSLDFAELAPEFVVRAGTQSGSMPRRGALSTDGGSTWSPFATEPTDGRGEGSIAISADGATIVWAPRGTGAVASYSTDRGATWTACAGLGSGARVSADRAAPNVFYALLRNGTELWVSTDGAVSFSETASGLASVSGRPRAVFGIEGELWLPTARGLLRSSDAGQTLVAMADVQMAYAVGFGKAAPGASYPSIYLGGALSNQLGLYRSDDAGESWLRIDDSKHQFGYLNVIAGDPQSYGGVYLGTSGRGIIYGEPAP